MIVPVAKLIRTLSLLKLLSNGLHQHHHFQFVGDGKLIIMDHPQLQLCSRLYVRDVFEGKDDL